MSWLEFLFTIKAEQGHVVWRPVCHTFHMSHYLKLSSVSVTYSPSPQENVLRKVLSNYPSVSPKQGNIEDNVQQTPASDRRENRGCRS